MSYDDNEDNSGIGKLRKEFKEQAKLLKEQQDLISSLMAERNSAGVADLLASQGLDPRVAKFYPKDAATDAASVTAWVEDNKDLFGNRRVVDKGELNSDTLTDAEKRGYQAVQDIQAYESGLIMDFDQKLRAVEYDPMDPIGSQNKLMAAIEEAARYLT